MTHARAFLCLLRDGPKDLGQILHAEGGRFAAEYRKFKVLLNRGGEDIRLHLLRKDGTCRGCAGPESEALPTVPPLPSCPAVTRGQHCYQWHGAPAVMAVAMMRDAHGQLCLA